jgi:hypothetical protein
MSRYFPIAFILIIVLTMMAVTTVSGFQIISPGDTIFRGEEGVDICSTGVGAGDTIAWYGPGSTPGVSPPGKTVIVPNPVAFYVDPNMDTGAWYQSMSSTTAAFYVADPTIAIQSMTPSGHVVNDKTVIKGDVLRFRILTNLDVICQRTGALGAPVRIRVAEPGGAVYTALFDDTGVLHNLADIQVNTNPFIVTGGAGSTGVWDTGNANYVYGTYTVTADCNVNRMNDNYNQIGKTVSGTHSITLTDDTLSLISNKDSVIRAEDFKVTIKGNPGTQYVLWVKNTRYLVAGEVPAIKDGQQGVVKGSTVAGAYKYWEWMTVTEDTPSADQYAMVTTNDEGTRDIDFQTTEIIHSQFFTIRTERYVPVGPSWNYDEVRVLVKKDNIEPSPGEVAISLQKGWNFISTPKRLEVGNNTAMIFSDVDTGGRSIFSYNALSLEWEAIGVDTEIRPLDGYWIYANTSTTVPLIFASGAAQTPPTKTLHQGWNAIGAGSLEPATARDTLISVSQQWTQVLGWRRGTQTYNTAIIIGGAGAYSDSRPMYPTEGYWIYMKEGGLLAALC